MEDLKVFLDIIEYVYNNAEYIVDKISNVVFLFSVIAAATPTPKDDTLAKSLYKVVDILAVNVWKAKQK